MNLSEQQAILTVALLAAFADGEKADAEREAIRRMAESLGPEAGGAGLAQLYQDVLLKRVTVQTAVAGLSDPGHRHLAYEMAVCVCDADGRKSPAESAFLADLKTRLGLGASDTVVFEQEETALVEASRQGVPAAGTVALATATATAAAAATGAGAGAGAGASVSAPAAVALNNPPAAEMDKLILNASLLNGALELLPQSWASMAIIPLQIRMVYNIGKAHGVELDQGHIREFIAAAGVGLSSQYIEQFGRKLIGGLLGKVAGRLGAGIGGAATGMAFSFATTYALGQLAKRYYAGGRSMNTALLKDTFQSLLGPAKQLQTQYLPQIQQTASTLDAGKVLALVRGSPVA